MLLEILPFRLPLSKMPSEARCILDKGLAMCRATLGDGQVAGVL